MLNEMINFDNQLIINTIDFFYFKKTKVVALLNL
jgi:hypothetical protein